MSAASVTSPFFSVVIPTYNRAAFIADTLRSVLSQTYKSLEIIVVDDGSMDNTAEIVKQFEDPRLTYYPKQNEERGKARNYGLAHSKGEYILFLDSDDYLHSNHLQTLYNNIIEEDYPNFIATKYNFSRDGKLSDSELAPLPAGKYGFDFFVQGNALACNFCVRRANPLLCLFEEDRQYAAVEDWMFLLENTQHDTIYLIDAVTLTMNDHDSRSMRADNSGLIRRLTAAMSWMKEHLNASEEQMHHLLAHVHYLCAVHYYMDGHRREALAHWRHAWSGISWRRRLPLFMRIMLGSRIIDKLKRWA